MRFGSLSIQVLLCITLASAPRLAAGQTEPGATGTTASGEAVPGEAVPAPPAEGEPVVTGEQPAPAQPALTQPAPAQPGWGATGPESETPWSAPQPAPAEPAQPAPAQPGWGTPAEGTSTGWGAPAQGESAGWGDPNAAAWGEQPSFDLPEDQRVGSWPLLVSLGVGYGVAMEGTVNTRASALTLQPGVFLGLLKHFGINHGPALSIPVGLPDFGSPSRFGVSFGFVPGYQLAHFFRRDMFWGFGVGVPLLIAPLQGSAKDEYSFNAGVELSAQFGYKFLAGLGLFARFTVDIFPHMYAKSYDLTTIGGELGLCMYYDWFRPWEPPTMATGLEEGVLP
jgi:hypothetical protein